MAEASTDRHETSQATPAAGCAVLRASAVSRCSVVLPSVWSCLVLSCLILAYLGCLVLCCCVLLSVCALLSMLCCVCLLCCAVLLLLLCALPHADWAFIKVELGSAAHTVTISSSTAPPRIFHNSQFCLQVRAAGAGVTSAGWCGTGGVWGCVIGA